MKDRLRCRATQAESGTPPDRWAGLTLDPAWDGLFLRRPIVLSSAVGGAVASCPSRASEELGGHETIMRDEETCLRTPRSRCLLGNASDACRRPISRSMSVARPVVHVVVGRSTYVLFWEQLNRRRDGPSVRGRAPRIGTDEVGRQGNTMRPE